MVEWFEMVVWWATFIGIGLAIMNIGRLVARRHGWSSVAIATALLAFYTLVALAELDDLLATMHEPTVAGHRLEDLSSLSTFDDPQASREAVAEWTAWYAGDERRVSYATSPSSVARWYLNLDSFVLIPLYGLALTMFVQRARRYAWQLANAPSTPEPLARDILRQRTMASFATHQLLVALIAVDLAEDRLLGRVLAAASGRGNPIWRGDAAIWILHVLTALKWALVVGAVVSTLPLLAGLIATHRPQIRSALRSLFRVRGLIVAVAVFGLVAILPLQTPDVIRRWDLPHALISVAAAALLAGVARVLGRRLILATRHDTDPDNRPWVIAAGVLMIAGGLSFIPGWGPRGLLILGLIVGLIVVLGIGGVDDTPVPSPRAGFAPGAIPRVLAAAPMLLLGLAAIRAYFANNVYQLTDGSWWWALGVLVVWAVGPVVLTVLGYRLIRDPGTAAAERMWFWWTVGAALAIVVAVWIALLADVVAVSQALGALTIAALFATVLAIAFGALTMWAEVTPPPPGLAVFGLRRTPVFLLLLLWIAFADSTGGGTFHDVRVLDGAAPVHASLTLKDAWTGWLDRQPAVATPLGEGRAAIPMVFVATGGGGIKAAVWTAYVLDCVLRGGPAVEVDVGICAEIAPEGSDRTGSVFAASGISGGSLGLIEYVANEIATDGTPDPGWVSRVLSHDFVSPSLAWQLFVEAPRALLRFDPGRDRAAVLEQSWEAGWLEGTTDDTFPGLTEGFLQTYADHPELPLLPLNGTSVEGACRFVVSSLETDGRADGSDCSRIQQLERDADGGDPTDGEIFASSRDVLDFLCADGGRRADLALSTAALLSARFPYVSPSGRLPACAGTGSVHVVDGGYLDNSGGTSIAELWGAIGAEVNEYNRQVTGSCVVPYLLAIDSGYLATNTELPEQVSEPLAPGAASVSARASRSVEGRLVAALPFRRPLVNTGIGDRYAIVYLRSEPGAHVPLGWTLSEASFEELQRQLQANADQLRKVAGWFDGTTTCPPA